MSLVEACVPNSASRSIGAPGSRHPRGRNQDMSGIFAIQFRPKYVRGGLAPWQEKRAKEMLRANLSGDLGLPELASACRLSSGQFSRAFKRTVGCPPHQWLLHQRVERAKELILNTDEPLRAIALDTGFADQSHFTRVFSQRVKATPAAWRRDHETMSDAGLVQAEVDSSVHR